MLDSNTVVAGGLVGGVVYALSYFITKSVRVTSANYIEQLKQLRLDNKALRDDVEALTKRNRELEQVLSNCQEGHWQLVQFLESKGHKVSEFKTRKENIHDFDTRDK